MMALHLRAPAVQAVSPAEQTPGRPEMQATLPPGLPLSTLPSQSSSTLLQVSAVGMTSPWHGPHTPFEQLCVPALHGPLFSVSGG
jgi:hypothetical protein